MHSSTQLCELFLKRSLFFRLDLTQWYKIIPAGALERLNLPRIGFKREEKRHRKTFYYTVLKNPTKQYLALDQDMGLKLVEFPWATRKTSRHISLNADIGNNIKVALTQLCDLAGLMISFPLIMFL